MRCVYDNTTQALIAVNGRDGPSQVAIHQCMGAEAVSLSVDTEGGTDDHLLDNPLETLDAIRNSATMKGVLGWSNQLEEVYLPERNK